MSSSIIARCSRQARIAAEALPLYRRGTEALTIERNIYSADADRRWSINKIAQELDVPFDVAEGIHDMMGRRERGERE